MKNMKLKSKSTIAQMCVANIVPNMIAPKLKKNEKFDNKQNLIREGKNLKMEPLSEEQQSKLMTKLDLTGIENWSKEDQELVKELFKDFG